MPLTKEQVVEQVQHLIEVRNAEQPRIEWLRQYLRPVDEYMMSRWGGRQYHTGWLPENAPFEVRRLARIAHVPIVDYTVTSGVQSLYVNGYRSSRSENNEPIWPAWQANKMDKRQSGVHRSGLSFGAGWVNVLPGTDRFGKPMPVIRGVSPTDVTALYGEDEDWPMYVLEKRRTASKGKLWCLYDETHRYWVAEEPTDDRLAYISEEEHGAGVNPWVRFLNDENLEEGPIGEVQRLIPLQEQIDVTTFLLLVAQHYGAHRQRYILGWMADSEEEALEATASRIWNFKADDDGPNNIEVGEFEQTDVKGYIESRETSIKHLVSLAQAPVVDLQRELVNVSAEAIEALNQSYRRHSEALRINFGESWEQTLELAAQLMGLSVDETAQVRWKDTESRSLSQSADALGKIADMLKVPVQELWPYIPLGQTEIDLERWQQTAEEQAALTDPMRQLDSFIGSQMGEIPSDDEE